MMTQSPLTPLARSLLLALLTAGLALLAGCTGNHRFERYLDQGAYDEGVDYVLSLLAKAPNDPVNHYYAGRYYLALDEPESALPHLQRAAVLDPNQPAYFFWLGVAHWEMRDFDSERKAYEQALALDPSYSQALLYLGHNHLDRGEYQEALQAYQRLLQQRRDHPEALFNRAQGLTNLGQTASALAAWKEYLRYHPQGEKALEAVRQLNKRGDFSYRSHMFGVQRIVLPAIVFAQDSEHLTPASVTALASVGAILLRRPDLRIQVVAYREGDGPMARRRAERVKAALLIHSPRIDPDRIQVSGIDRRETLTLDDKTFQLDNTVDISTVKSVPASTGR